MKSISVFCGSSSGIAGVYREKARELGKELAKRKVRIIYGGAKIGLMGVVADAAIEYGGEVIGVLPRFLTGKEIAHENLTELILVETMHERKLRMSELSEGVIALPGGFGTMEEFFEMLTWGQLGLHKKPVGILNINGFYTHMAGFIRTMTTEGFLNEEHQKMVLVSEDVTDLLSMMDNFKAPDVKKWLDQFRT